MSLLTASNLSKVYEPDTIFTGVSAEIPQKARIALVGPNGAGKTSLVKLFIGEEKPNTGQIHIARGTTISYLPQRPELIGGHSVWDEQMRAFEHLHEMEIEMADLATKMGDSPEAVERYGYLQEHYERQGGYNFEARVRMILSGVGFSENEYQTPLTKLSGGQKTRAVLARLLLETPDLLILDEPTNHLDIDSQEILQAVIENFGGTVLLVSHDRYLIDALATQIWAIRADDGMEVYEGTYQEYIALRKQRETQISEVSNGNTRKKSAQYAQKVRGMNPFQLKKRVEELEQHITKLESQLEALTSQIEAASSLGAADKILSLGAQYTKTESHSKRQ
ncbi:MAG: ATP-binding cassette domain-containing protein [Anaerolineae bacterium]|nr:ATP-binding cassette domain-containing protein [Anaerolineae bacterium]